MRKYWTDDEINYLIENYSNKRNDELSIELKKTLKSIYKKAYVLRLKKSKEHKSEMIGLRNKIVGRDLSYENLKNIAKTYKSRGEFQKLDSSAYSVARTMGILNDICSHMIKQSYSIPQLLLFEILKILISPSDIIYNSRKIIKPYELDVYIPEYKIAFEYNGKRWHLNNENDIIKQIKCDELNITLIKIEENNRKYVDDIKKQLINKLDCINKVCKINLKSEDILDIDEKDLYLNIKDSILDENDVKNIISKYKTLKDFRINEEKLYKKLCKINMLDNYINILVKTKNAWSVDDIEMIKSEISKYEYLLDFIQNSRSCYTYIKRHGLNHLLVDLKRNNIIWNFNKIKDLIIKYNYNTTNKIKINYSSVFIYLKKHNLISECREFMKKNQK
jgi:hypothetical protein